MTEDKKAPFPWVQLIATIGTIVAAFIGITPYLLKLNQPSSSAQAPTIVFVTLPTTVPTPVPSTTAPPVTVADTTPVPTQTIVMTTLATTGPPPTGNETPVPTTEATMETTLPPTTPALPPGPAIQISVNTSSVPRGGIILASGSTDPAVPRVTITLTNSTTFQSEPVPVPLMQEVFQFQVDTTAYAPGDYTISAAVPDTQAVASASFVITPA